MPLDITPAPAALPGAAPPRRAGGTRRPGARHDRQRALLFGLLLAQTVGQTAPRPRPSGRTVPNAPRRHADSQTTADSHRKGEDKSERQRRARRRGG